jgi:hypothetical protein
MREGRAPLEQQGQGEQPRQERAEEPTGRLAAVAPPGPPTHASSYSTSGT